LFLSKAERDFLLSIGREISKTQQRYIRYKLRRKLKQFCGVELPLLIEKGYVITSVAANTNAVAAGGHVSHEQTNKTSVEHAQNDTTHGTYEPWQGVCTG
jgi:hypothetical protein